ncbi:hypothetical protein MVEN_00356200 [Mycena venus]|uniref:F-box domain-containing protein n=1 Tax=Mycena venus TaxID=2733690 RepID=A0A8H6YTF0_9AGAR|nr:hypothetical protein MVEN_00356200 [Mycena venus]
MRRIPQDVLVEIFMSCLPSEHNALIDSAEAPLLLGRICRHWRCVAYSTPMLWSSIHIPSFDYNVVPPDILFKLERMVEAWLERSGTCSLSVSLFDPTVHSTVAAHPLISQLLPVSQRLRQLALSRFGDAGFFRPLLQLGSEALPLLKSVRIETTANLLIQEHPEAMNMFQIPTVEDVSLRISESVDPLSLPLKWSQLTGLNLACYRLWTQNGPLGGLDLGGALNVLRMCPNLRRCELRMTKAPEDVAETVDPTPIILPHIHTLIFKGRFNFDGWISHLVVPDLRYLQVGEEISGDAASLPTQDGDGCMRAHIDPDYFTTGSSGALTIFPHDLPSPTIHADPPIPRRCVPCALLSTARLVPIVDPYNYHDPRG